MLHLTVPPFDAESFSPEMVDPEEVERLIQKAIRRVIMSDVIGPSGPGDICGDCGHFAFRHVPVGCDCSDLVEMGIREKRCSCRMMKWNGRRWFGERLEQEEESSDEEVKEPTT